ncbi:hypothetical protein MD484_g8807, partial [Candolleomyces efflorescens]
MPDLSEASAGGSSSQSKPFTLPVEIVENIIDHALFSKADLLSLALVGGDWVKRSRHQLFQTFLRHLSLNGFDEILSFSSVVNDSRNTFDGKILCGVTLHADHLSSRDGLDNITLLTYVVIPFLEQVVVTESIDIKLSRGYSMGHCARALWDVVFSWTSLRYVSISAEFSCPGVVATFITSLTNLHTLSINATYLISTIPDSLTSPLPESFRVLRIGPCGYSLLSWLARFEGSANPIDHLALQIDSGSDVAHLRNFIVNHKGIIHLHVSFHDAKMLHNFSHLLSTLKGLLAFYIHFKFSSILGYSRFIDDLVSNIASPGLKLLYFNVPRLVDCIDDEEVIVETIYERLAASFGAQRDRVQVGLFQRSGSW